MRNATQKDYEQRILRVLVHIQANLDACLGLDELAALAHFSPYHFHRVFRGMVGEPVREHVRRLRLERAAMQLKGSDLAVTQIALGAGFETHEAFTRAFRSMFSDSPSGFRRTHRPLPVVPSGVHYAPEGEITFSPLEAEAHTMEVRIEECQPMRVAFMRHVGPYHEVSATWQKLMGWAASRGMFGAMMKPIGICHDDPEITPPEKLRYDACLAVSDKFAPEGDIGVQDVSGGPYAVTVHKGPYERIGQTYAALMGQWIPAQDREPASASCLEIYLNNPQQTPPEELLTEVHVPLKPA